MYWTWQGVTGEDRQGQLERRSTTQAGGRADARRASQRRRPRQSRRRWRRSRRAPGPSRPAPVRQGRRPCRRKHGGGGEPSRAGRRRRRRLARGAEGRRRRRAVEGESWGVSAPGRRRRAQGRRLRGKGSGWVSSELVRREARAGMLASCRFGRRRPAETAAARVSGCAGPEPKWGVATETAPW